MPIFHEAQIEAAVAEKQRDSLPPGWQRAYYDFCARVSPEISRWAMHAPACPANLWSGMHIPSAPCNCGAAYDEAKRLKQIAKGAA